MGYKLNTIVENLEDYLAKQDWDNIDKNVRKAVKIATDDQIEELFRVLEIFDEYCRKSDFRKKHGLQNKGIFWDLPCQNLAGFILRRAISSDGEWSDKFYYVKHRITLIKVKSLCESPRRSKRFSEELYALSFDLEEAMAYFSQNGFFVHHFNAQNLLCRMNYINERIAKIPHDYSFSNYSNLFDRLIEHKEKVEEELDYVFDNEVMPDFEFLSDYEEESYNQEIDEKVMNLEEENEEIGDLIYSTHLNLTILSAEVGLFYRAKQMATEFQSFYDIDSQTPEVRKVMRLLADGEQDFRKIRKLIGNKFPYS